MTDKDRLQRLNLCVIAPEHPILDAISVLDKAGTGVLLVCEADRKLKGVITDGDIRRAILNGISLEESCSKIMLKSPVTARSGLSDTERLHLLDQSKSFYLNQLPIVDDQGKVVDLILRRDLVTEVHPDFNAVIMTGGYGTRLHPLTKNTPKSMLAVGEQPILEGIIGKLKENGIQNVTLATHFLSEQIESHFGDGKKYGLNISYQKEDEPLGTAGALSLIPKPKKTLLVINGDIQTDMDFSAMFDFHRINNAAFTVALKKYDIEIPFGIAHLDNIHVRRIQEKPNYSFLVNAGIYIMEPDVLEYIPRQAKMDMPQLIDILLKEEKEVIGYPIHEYWIDIGSHQDLEKARKNISK